MMYFWSTDQRRFLDYLADGKPVKASVVRHRTEWEEFALKPDSVVMVWADAPVDRFELPNAVVVASTSVAPFCAWVSTYLRQMRPFSAQCRILTPETARLASLADSRDRGERTGPIEIGLILAEAAAYAAGRPEPSRLSFVALTRTLSYALAECAVRYPADPSNLGFLHDQTWKSWALLRDSLNQPPLSLAPAAIGQVWEAANDSSRTDRPDADSGLQAIRYALRELRDTGRIPAPFWNHLGMPSRFGDMIDEVAGAPRESRVRALEGALPDLVVGPDESRRLRAFTLGYMASRIQPGTLEHFHVLNPAAGRLRESFLWYGACAGASPEASVNAFGNGLGLLVKRELSRRVAWLDRPMCDIGLPELLALSAPEVAKPVFRTLVPGLLRVEVFPLVHSVVRWAEAADELIERARTDDDQRSLFDSRGPSELADILKELERNTDQLRSIRFRVEQVIGGKDAARRRPRR